MAGINLGNVVIYTPPSSLPSNLNLKEDIFRNLLGKQNKEKNIIDNNLEVNINQIQENEQIIKLLKNISNVVENNNLPLDDMTRNLENLIEIIRKLGISNNIIEEYIENIQNRKDYIKQMYKKNNTLPINLLNTINIEIKNALNILDSENVELKNRISQIITENTNLLESNKKNIDNLISFIIESIEKTGTSGGANKKGKSEKINSILKNISYNGPGNNHNLMVEIINMFIVIYQKTKLETEQKLAKILQQQHAKDLQEKTTELKNKIEQQEVNLLGKNVNINSLIETLKKIEMQLSGMERNSKTEINKLEKQISELEKAKGKVVMEAKRWKGSRNWMEGKRNYYMQRLADEELKRNSNKTKWVQNWRELENKHKTAIYNLSKRIANLEEEIIGKQAEINNLRHELNARDENPVFAEPVFNRETTANNPSGNGPNTEVPNSTNSTNLPVHNTEVPNYTNFPYPGPRVEQVPSPFSYKEDILRDIENKLKDVIDKINIPRSEKREEKEDITELREFYDKLYDDINSQRKQNKKRNKKRNKNINSRFNRLERMLKNAKQSPNMKANSSLYKKLNELEHQKHKIEILVKTGNTDSSSKDIINEITRAIKELKTNKINNSQHNRRINNISNAIKKLQSKKVNSNISTENIIRLIKLNERKLNKPLNSTPIDTLKARINMKIEQDSNELKRISNEIKTLRKRPVINNSRISSLEKLLLQKRNSFDNSLQSLKNKVEFQNKLIRESSNSKRTLRREIRNLKSELSKRDKSIKNQRLDLERRENKLLKNSKNILEESRKQSNEILKKARGNKNILNATERKSKNILNAAERKSKNIIRQAELIQNEINAKQREELKLSNVQSKKHEKSSVLSIRDQNDVRLEINSYNKKLNKQKSIIEKQSKLLEKSKEKAEKDQINRISREKKISEDIERRIKEEFEKKTIKIDKNITVKKENIDKTKNEMNNKIKRIRSEFNKKLSNTKKQRDNAMRLRDEAEIKYQKLKRISRDNSNKKVLETEYKADKQKVNKMKNELDNEKDIIYEKMKREINKIKEESEKRIENSKEEIKRNIERKEKLDELKKYRIRHNILKLKEKRNRDIRRDIRRAERYIKDKKEEETKKAKKYTRPKTLKIKLEVVKPSKKKPSKKKPSKKKPMKKKTTKRKPSKGKK